MPTAPVLPAFARDARTTFTEPTVSVAPRPHTAPLRTGASCDGHYGRETTPVTSEVSAAGDPAGRHVLAEIADAVGVDDPLGEVPRAGLELEAIVILTRDDRLQRQLRAALQHGEIGASRRGVLV